VTAKGRTGPKVRGKCANGHEFETQARAGRVTWTGPCPVEGCGLHVEAKRVAPAKPAKPKDDETSSEPPAAKPTKRGKHKVVAGYRNDPTPPPHFEEPTHARADDDRGADGGGPGVQDPAAGAAGGSGDHDDPAAGAGGDGTSSRPVRRPGWRARRAGRRAAALQGTDDPAHWTIPGIYR
jgi:hypothetical protein